jgi:hypothetical protein
MERKKDETGYSRLFKAKAIFCRFVISAFSLGHRVIHTIT